MVCLFFRLGITIFLIMIKKGTIMNNSLVVISYTLSALSGICFVTGIAVLLGGKGVEYGKF